MDITEQIFESQEETNRWAELDNPGYPTPEIIKRTEGMTTAKCKWYSPNYRECNRDGTYCVGLDNCPKISKKVALSHNSLKKFDKALKQIKKDGIIYYPSTVILRKYGIYQLFDHYVRANNVTLEEIYDKYGFKPREVDGIKFKRYESLMTYLKYKEEIINGYLKQKGLEKPEKYFSEYKKEDKHKYAYFDNHRNYGKVIIGILNEM